MHEVLPQILFYVFAAMVVCAGFLVITQNNPVRCVLFLVVAFVGSAVLWLMVGAEFLALILVLVYVGAVMTLFLFVVMMLNIDEESAKKNFISWLPMGLLVVAGLVALFIKVLPGHFGHGSLVDVPQQALSNTQQIGMVLYTDYVYAFILAAVLLLVAIIAAITLVHRERQDSKRQNVTQQIMTKRSDRVKLVSMKAEQ